MKENSSHVKQILVQLLQACMRTLRFNLIIKKRWVEASLSAGDLERENLWTESVAVGSKSFIEKTKKHLGIKAIGRGICGGKQHYQLREQILDFGQSSLKGSEAVS